MSTPTRQVPAWLLPAGLGALVVTLASVALLRGPVELDPGTPKGTVQEYLVAIDDERWDDAIEILHEGWRGDCAGSDLEAFSPDDFSAELGTDFGMSGRVTRESFEVVAIPPDDGKTAPPTGPESTSTVEVTIHRGSQGGLGSGWSEHVTFELVEEDDFWWLTGDPWPYFIWSCGGQ